MRASVKKQFTKEGLEFRCMACDKLYAYGFGVMWPCIASITSESAEAVFICQKCYGKLMVRLVSEQTL